MEELVTSRLDRAASSAVEQGLYMPLVGGSKPSPRTDVTGRFLGAARVPQPDLIPATRKQRKGRKGPETADFARDPSRAKALLHH
jgi:hypothetical protein